MTLRSFILALLAVFIFTACNNFSKKSNDGVYGQTFDTTNAVAASQFVTQIPTSQSNALVKGTITNSCKTEGCWLKLDAGNGNELFVSTEEEFFIPLEGMKGKTVYVTGVTITDTTSVEQLKVIATDEGKTESEVHSITDPKVEVSILATGVKVL